MNNTKKLQELKKKVPNNKQERLEKFGILDVINSLKLENDFRRIARVDKETPSHLKESISELLSHSKELQTSLDRLFSNSNIINSKGEEQVLNILTISQVIVDISEEINQLLNKELNELNDFDEDEESLYLSKFEFSAFFKINDYLRFYNNFCDDIRNFIMEVFYTSDNNYETIGKITDIGMSLHEHIGEKFLYILCDLEHYVLRNIIKAIQEK